MRTVRIGDEFIPGSIDIGNVGVFWNPDEDTGVTLMSADRARTTSVIRRTG